MHNVREVVIEVKLTRFSAILREKWRDSVLTVSQVDINWKFSAKFGATIEPNVCNSDMLSLASYRTLHGLIAELTL